MRHHWHEQVLRYMNGQSSAEEAATLQEALIEGVELRALYLDYMNLDVALAAAAEMAEIAENGLGRTKTFPRRLARSPQHWRRLVATAACAALVVLAMLAKHRGTSRARTHIDAIISSTQSHIARLSVEPPSLFPPWASPTDSLLDQPHISE
ncbi:MAG TPA: hypothetical protein VGH65_00385 [Verrucomicrobiaceae bacterium]|jgi:anti-sigma-K factor RskA